jgi:hypothetical protein
MCPTETTISNPPLPACIPSKSSLLDLPNELVLEVSSHLESFNDLNSLIRTSRFFHRTINTHLYRRAVAVAADDAVLNEIVGWVLSSYRLASLTLRLDHGLSVNHTGKFDDDRYTDKEPMLHFVCRLEDTQHSIPLARLLLERGADTRVEAGRYSDTVLYRAIFLKNDKMIALLLAHGADPNAAHSGYGLTPLQLACQTGRDRPELIQALIVFSADFDARTPDGATPLHGERYREMWSLLEKCRALSRKKPSRENEMLAEKLDSFATLFEREFRDLSGCFWSSLLLRHLSACFFPKQGRTQKKRIVRGAANRTPDRFFPKQGRTQQKRIVGGAANRTPDRFFPKQGRTQQKRIVGGAANRTLDRLYVLKHRVVQRVQDLVSAPVAHFQTVTLGVSFVGWGIGYD